MIDQIILLLSPRLSLFSLYSPSRHEKRSFFYNKKKRSSEKKTSMKIKRNKCECDLNCCRSVKKEPKFTKKKTTRRLRKKRRTIAFRDWLGVKESLVNVFKYIFTASSHLIFCVCALHPPQVKIMYLQRRKRFVIFRLNWTLKNCMRKFGMRMISENKASDLYFLIYSHFRCRSISLIFLKLSSQYNVCCVYEIRSWQQLANDFFSICISFHFNCDFHARKMKLTLCDLFHRFHPRVSNNRRKSRRHLTTTTTEMKIKSRISVVFYDLRWKERENRFFFLLSFLTHEWNRLRSYEKALFCAIWSWKNRQPSAI